MLRVLQRELHGPASGWLAATKPNGFYILQFYTPVKWNLGLIGPSKKDFVQNQRKIN